MILPALTLGLVLYGDYALIVRSAMLETLGEDYVLTARAKGLKNWTIVRRHGLRNAMLPIITLVALSLGLHHRRLDHRRVRLLLPGARAADGGGDRQARLPAAAGDLHAADPVGDLLQPGRRPALLPVRPAGDGMSLIEPLQAADEEALCRGHRAEQPARLRPHGDPRQPAGDGRARRPRVLRLRRGVRPLPRAVRPDRQDRRRLRSRRAAPTGSEPTTAAATCSRC